MKNRLTSPAHLARIFILGTATLLFASLLMTAVWFTASFVSRERDRGVTFRKQAIASFEYEYKLISEEAWTQNYESIRYRIARLTSSLGANHASVTLWAPDGLCLYAVHVESEKNICGESSTTALNPRHFGTISNPFLKFNEDSGTYLYAIKIEIGSEHRANMAVSFDDPNDLMLERSRILVFAFRSISIPLGVALVVWILWFAIAMKFIARPYIDRLIALERNAALASAIQMLAHDVRKPFSMLRIGLTMLGSAKDPESVKRVMSRIVPEIDKAMSSVDGMIADVMEVGSSATSLIQEASSPESLIESTLGEIIRMYPDAKISFLYDLKHVHMTNVHVHKMGRVFSNIVGNSFQAMRNKGEMWFKTTEADGMITVCIGNAGSMIPADSLPKLFEAFFTSGKKGGTGLGLAIAQKVVNAHGGKIWCESCKTSEHPDGKVEFFFTLPISNQINTTTATLPQQSSDIAKQIVFLAENAPASLNIDKGELSLEEDLVRTRGVLARVLRVLIIDDEAIYRISLASNLTRTPELQASLEIVQAKGSEIALKAISDGPFDLIITDVDMGASSLDGFELVRELRRRGSKSLICVHSNRIFAADSKTAMESGADSFMPKPMARAQLLRVLLHAAAIAEAGHAPTIVASSMTATSKPSILVIDDSSFVLYAWEDAIANDAMLHTMRSFEELQQRLLMDPEFLHGLSYVITDMHLDGSQGDGLDVGRLIKSLRQDLPVLMSSNDIFNASDLVGAVDKVIAKEAVGLALISCWRTRL
jgi:signal transduction histidine kinase/CheY-like chemotaxis protein